MYTVQHLFELFAYDFLKLKQISARRYLTIDCKMVCDRRLSDALDMTVIADKIATHITADGTANPGR